MLWLVFHPYGGEHAGGQGTIFIDFPWFFLPHISERLHLLSDELPQFFFIPLSFSIEETLKGIEVKQGICLQSAFVQSLLECKSEMNGHTMTVDPVCDI